MVMGDTDGRLGVYVGLAGELGCPGGVRVWSAEVRAKSGLEEMKLKGIIVSTRGVCGRNREASCWAPSSHVATTVAGLCFFPHAPAGMNASGEVLFHIASGQLLPSPAFRALVESQFDLSLVGGTSVVSGPFHVDSPPTCPESNSRNAPPVCVRGGAPSMRAGKGGAG
jgi:hypothetical protein